MGHDVAEAVERPKERFVDFITGNFGAVSAGLTAIAAALSIIFVFGYLASFDVVLVMTIEYADVFKFILIGTCIVFALWTSFIFILSTGVDIFARWNSRRGSVY